MQRLKRFLVTKTETNYGCWRPVSGNSHLLEKPTPQCTVRRQNVLALEPGYKSFQHLFHSTVELSLPLGFGDKSYCGLLSFREMKSYIFKLEKPTHSTICRQTRGGVIIPPYCGKGVGTICTQARAPVRFVVVLCIAVWVFLIIECYPTWGVKNTSFLYFTNFCAPSRRLGVQNLIRGTFDHRGKADFSKSYQIMLSSRGIIKLILDKTWFSEIMKYNKCHRGIIIRTRWDGHDRTDGPTTCEADGNDDRIASQLLNRCHVLFVVYVFSCMSLFRSLLFIF